MDRLLNIPEDIRETLFQNLHKLSANLIPIDTQSSTSQNYIATNDLDQDTNVESLSDIDSDDNDSYNDLENRLFDHIAMEYDITAFHAGEEYNEEPTYDNDHQNNPTN